VNLLNARVVLRPRSLADVLDLTVPFCLSNWRLLRTLTLTALLPAFALCLYLRLGQHWSWPHTWLLAVILADFLEGLFTVACGDLMFQPSTAVRAASVWGRYLRRLGFTIGSLIVTRFLLGLCAITMIGIPAVPFLAPFLMFVREVGLLEGAQVFAAIGRGYRFVQRQYLSCFGLLVAVALAPVVMGLAAELLGDAIVEKVLQLGSPFGDLFKEWGSAYALLGFFLAVPVVAAARFLKYIDVRTRKEGWDIQLRFTAVAAAETQQPGSSAA
jgi:hypothetical protein